MKQFFVTENLEMPENGTNLMDEIVKKLVTEDVQIAIRAGCHFEVSLINTEKGVTMSLKSKEKVSMLKTKEGQVVSIIIKQ